MMYDRIGYILKEVQAALRAQMDQALADRGVTVPQFAALYALETMPGLSNAELARNCFVTPQTMIRVVTGLEERGLIARKPHPTHGRILTAELTATGRKLIASCHQGINEVEDRMLESLTPRERKQLKGLLRRCAGSLEG